MNKYEFEDGDGFSQSGLAAEYWRQQREVVEKSPEMKIPDNMKGLKQKDFYAIQEAKIREMVERRDWSAKKIPEIDYGVLNLTEEDLELLKGMLIKA